MLLIENLMIKFNLILAREGGFVKMKFLLTIYYKNINF